MSNAAGPGNLASRFMAVCLAVLVGALALNWAMCLVSQVWLQLTICVGIVVMLAGVVTIVRWRRNRW